MMMSELKVGCKGSKEPVMIIIASRAAEGSHRENGRRQGRGRETGIEIGQEREIGTEIETGKEIEIGIVGITTEMITTGSLLLRFMRGVGLEVHRDHGLIPLSIILPTCNLRGMMTEIIPEIEQGVLSRHGINTGRVQAQATAVAAVATLL
jgi:hypothetical protein